MARAAKSASSLDEQDVAATESETTPTAIANMTAVTEKFGASAKAFVVVPLVGAFFIDIANALIIQFLLDSTQ